MEILVGLLCAVGLLPVIVGGVYLIVQFIKDFTDILKGK